MKLELLAMKNGSAVHCPACFVHTRYVDGPEYECPECGMANRRYGMTPRFRFYVRR